ncbi:MAG TPA: sulfotransferase, partial [Azospirillum sp.]
MMNVSSTVPECSALPDDPIVIGATGGSGTRMVRAVLERAGVFMGTIVNETGDCMLFEPLLDRLVNPVLTATRSLDYRAADLPPELLREGVALYRQAVARHLAEAPAHARAWGWKNPRSLYLLPIIAAAFPRLRVVHVVRDGRDMALSRNRLQLAKHYAALFGEPAPVDDPLAACRLWEATNRTAADWAGRELGGRYIRLSFEDICAAPERAVDHLLGRLGLPRAMAGDAAGAVRPPGSLGRWRAL